MFVSDEKCNEIAEEMLLLMEVGDLHSQSKIKHVARAAMILLHDEGLPARWSLACVIAKKAQAAWQEQIHRTKRKLDRA
tara:strand:+ start:115 stop:351 length:237 start_codon:yes stop_codon:yes gene_type:complete